MDLGRRIGLNLSRCFSGRISTVGSQEILAAGYRVQIGPSEVNTVHPQALASDGKRAEFVDACRPALNFRTAPSRCHNCWENFGDGRWRIDADRTRTGETMAEQRRSGKLSIPATGEADDQIYLAGGSSRRGEGAGGVGDDPPVGSSEAFVCVEMLLVDTKQDWVRT